jgi:hypothetical protein
MTCKTCSSALAQEKASLKSTTSIEPYIGARAQHRYQ